MNKPLETGSAPKKANQPKAEKPAPKVSIVIPVYNREKYLGIAVRSVLDQTFTDLELIIVDDGSTDGSLTIAEQFAKEDDRVRVLSNPINKGAAHALKKGFEAARGEYVGQVDSDDRLEMRAVELTTKVLNEDSLCGMVYTNYVDIDNNGRKFRPGRRCSIPYSREKLLTNFMTFHFRLIRTSVYKQAGGFDVQFNRIEDYDLCLRISEIANIQKINDYLYQHRVHLDSLQSNMDDLEKMSLNKKVINQALKRRGIDKTHKLKVTLNSVYSIEQVKTW